MTPCITPRQRMRSISLAWCFQWIKRQGGVAVLEQKNIAKARLLYDYLDSSDFYTNRVAKDSRSRMNVPFFLKDDGLNTEFLAQAKANGLLQLKGHKSVGGMRASIYNAMPIEGVQALINFMQDFCPSTFLNAEARKPSASVPVCRECKFCAKLSG